LKSFKIFYPKRIEAHCVAKVRLLFLYATNWLTYLAPKTILHSSFIFVAVEADGVPKANNTHVPIIEMFQYAEASEIRYFCGVFSLCGGYMVKIVDEMVAPSR
jgi:hypothetical protein